MIRHVPSIYLILVSLSVLIYTVLASQGVAPGYDVLIQPAAPDDLMRTTVLALPGRVIVPSAMLGLSIGIAWMQFKLPEKWRKLVNTKLPTIKLVVTRP